MLVTSIMGLVEPVSYSLENSLSWSLTKSLQSKQQFQLSDESGNMFGELVGISPLLQPVALRIGGTSAFLVCTRGVFNVLEGYQPQTNQKVDVKTINGTLMVSLAACATPKPKKMARITPYLGLTQGFESIPPAEQSVLKDYIHVLTAMLWSNEPLNWTTHNLQLSSTGKFMTSKEIHKLSLRSGVLEVSSSTYTVLRGPAPLGISFQPRWLKAGKTSTLTGLNSGCSTSSSSGSSTSSSGGSSTGGSTTCGPIAC